MGVFSSLGKAWEYITDETPVYSNVDTPRQTTAKLQEIKPVSNIELMPEGEAYVVYSGGRWLQASNGVCFKCIPTAHVVTLRLDLAKDEAKRMATATGAAYTVARMVVVGTQHNGQDWLDVADN